MLLVRPGLSGFQSQNLGVWSWEAWAGFGGSGKRGTVREGIVLEPIGSCGTKAQRVRSLRGRQEGFSEEASRVTGLPPSTWWGGVLEPSSPSSCQGERAEGDVSGLRNFGVSS